MHRSGQCCGGEGQGHDGPGRLRGGIGRTLDDHKLFSSGCLQASARCWRLREAEQREGTLERTDGEQSWQDSA